MGYHFFSKLTHWSSALIILGLLFLGFYMTSLAFSDFKLDLYLWHKSFGLLVLVLLVLRLFFVTVFKKPKPLSSHSAFERFLARLVHYVLYGALLLMPLSGWVMSSAGDYTVQFFGLHLQDIVQKDEALFERAKRFHEFLSFALIAAISLHVLGALKHHFIDRDETLKRMTSLVFGFKSGVVLAVLFGVVLAGYGVMVFEKYRAKSFEDMAAVEISFAEGAAPEIVAAVQAWEIVLDESSMVFEADQYGQSFEGRFERFGGQIFFDPQDLAQNRVRIVVYTDSLETGSADRDAQALSDVWFDASQYAHVVFEAKNFVHLGGVNYVANGHLEVRDVRLPFDLPFSLEIDGETALMRSSFSINRLDYNVGVGQDEQAVSNKVSFNVIVRAVKL